MGHCRKAAAVFPLLFVLASAAEAAQPADAPTDTPPVEAASPEPADAPPPAKDGWQFATIGYAWFANAHGETDVIGPAAPVGLDLSFSDVLKAFKFAFMGAAEARHDRFVALGDLTFIHLDTKKGIDIREQDFLDAELDSRTAEVTLLGGYRVADSGPVIVDLLGGGRINFFKTTLQLDGPNRSADGSVKQTWFDPLVAARVGVPLGGKWSASLYGDLGGIVMHVVVPLDASEDWPTVKSFAERFSRAISEAEPQMFTANIRKEQRKGRIFLDWLRNQRGATAVLPYSARGREGAPVAAPVAWDELDRYESGHHFSIRDADELLERASSKALAGWGKAKQALPDA